MAEYSRTSGYLDLNNMFVPRTSALCMLFQVCARLFSYPSVEWLTSFLQREYLDSCSDLLVDAYIGNDDLDRSIDSLRSVIDTTPAEQIACNFRREYTRLFVTPGKHIFLEGSWWYRRQCDGWVPSGSASSGYNPNDRARVAREYRKLGLRVREGVHYPPDHISNELDFVAYVLGMAAKCLSEMDIKSAKEWDIVAFRFVCNHLFEPTRGIYERGLQQTDDKMVVFSLNMLKAVVESFSSSSLVGEEFFDDW